MKKNLTEIIFVLDESGSMGSAKSDTIGGFNEFIENQKKVKGDVKFTFVKFSDYYKIVNDGTELAHVASLNESNYTPSFSTALRDAVGKTIDQVGNRLKNTPEDQRPEKVMFAVLTDGEENSSKEYSQEKVFEMVKHQTDKYKWEFLFLGADIDAWSGGSSIGFMNTVNTSKMDLKRSMKGMSNYTASYRVGADSMNLGTFNLSEEELDKQMEELQKNK